MANSGIFHSFIMLKTFMISSLVALLATNVGGSMCPPFSCGDLRNLSYPFRHLGDPPGCGAESCELNCSGHRATIHINTATYFVTEINYYSFNYDDSYFQVVDTNLDMLSNCPFPLTRWNYFPHLPRSINPYGRIDFDTNNFMWACFVNCSQAIMNNSWYLPVTCLSASNSYVYVRTGIFCSIGSLEPTCGYLAMIPLDDILGQNVSYVEIIKIMRKGFPIRFPNLFDQPLTFSGIMRTCLNESSSYFHKKISMPGILNKSRAFVRSEIQFLECLYPYRIKLFGVAVALISATDVLKYTIALALLLRLVVPLVVWTFLAHKFWQTKISVDAVEKFLRMQEALGPKRYAYTDITVITSYFRDKLGQGGYGSVYKGVLLPGHVHVAIKILAGSTT
uniref:Uncharacterized protein n=1 Tax=Avena sativa TaxID=4498 RepID=A0ACD5VJN7_AVESA